MVTSAINRVLSAIVAQLVRALDCGSKCRGFESRRSPMSLLHALILGLVQGITEFLPVSSSGHLMLAQHFLGFQNLSELVFFDLVCHLGTLLSIFTIFWKDIQETLRSKKILGSLFLATLPLVPLVFFIKPLKSIFDRLDLLGFFFLITACLIWLGTRFGQSKRETRWDSLSIGLFQALAIFPGVSRSGSTISGARLVGWPVEKAISFSFLLAIPTILGGFILELRHAINETLTLPLIPLIIGFLVSYLAGLLALKILIRQATKKSLIPFAWYCFFLGIFSLLYF